MTRHILGVLGVLAALVLLLVSMMMNYQFGSSLGKTATDKHIYGMASAAADCFKALAPFFFFAALRSRVWSQAVAAALVWTVVTVYAFTSAIGHAALNRFDTSGQRVVASASYKDTRAELQRAEEQLKWIPPHRPPATVEAEINVLKAQRTWMTTTECTDATIRASREFCQQYFKLAAELASGHEAQKHQVKIAELSAQAGKATGAAVLGMADPQASVIARLTGLELETVQTGLMLFVALLIEIGSGFGMYVAFAYWRPNQSLHGEPAPRSRTVEVLPVRKEEKAGTEERKPETQSADKADPIWTAEPTTVSADAKGGPPAVRPFGDNDNQTATKPAIMPPDDVQRFYQEYVDSADENDWVASMRLYEAYKLWCKRTPKIIGNETVRRSALAMPKFTEDFDKLKVVKHEIGGGVKYFGIALKPDVERDLEHKSSRKRARTVLTQEPAADQAKLTVDPTAADDRLAAAAGELRATADAMHAAIGSPPAAPGKAKAA
ncbi:MAG: hypothetical protein WAN86_10975 [Hyphomicrobiaceae bacterium]